MSWFSRSRSAPKHVMTMSSLSLPPTRQRPPSSSSSSSVASSSTRIPRARTAKTSTYSSPGTLTRREMRTPSPHHPHASVAHHRGFSEKGRGEGGKSRGTAGSRSRLWSAGSEDLEADDNNHDDHNNNGNNSNMGRVPDDSSFAQRKLSCANGPRVTADASDEEG